MAACLFRLLLTLIVFGAQEGLVRKIRFEGNRHFSDLRLANTITTQRNDIFSTFNASVDSSELVRFYRNQGFPWTSLEYSYELSRKRLTFRIKEGERLKISNIVTKGISKDDADLILAKIPLRKPFALTAFGLSETQRITRKYYLDRGYPYAVVETDTTTQMSNVELTIKVAPGVKAYIASVHFLGVADSIVNHNYLLKTTRLSTNLEYSAAKIDKASSFLYATSLFSRVESRISKASERDDSLDLSFDLTCNLFQNISLGAGLSTEQNSFLPDRLSLSAGWEHNNLFRRGVGLSIQSGFNPVILGSSRGNYLLDLKIKNRFPYFLPWGIALTLTPYWENTFNKGDSSNPTLTSHTVGGEIGLEKWVSEKFLTGISMQVKRNWSFADGIPYSPVDSIGKANFLRIFCSYDNRNDFFNPSSGIFLYPYADWAGTPFGGNNDFARISADFRNYLSLPLKMVLAWRLKAGIIIPHSGMQPELISHYEKFTLGGTGSVRAIAPKSIGPDSIIEDYKTIRDSLTGDSVTLPVYKHYGTLLLLHNLEVRTPYAFGWVGLVFFLDAGICARDANHIREDDWAWGPGVGIRVNTPIGPVRLDWSKDVKTPFVWNKDSIFTSNIGRFEIGFLQAF